MQFGHRRLEQDQDEHIQEIHTMAVKLKQNGEDINQELQRQDHLIHDLDQEMDLTAGRLKDLLGEVGQLLQTKDINQVCTCLLLFGMMMILIMLVIAI